MGRKNSPSAKKELTEIIQRYEAAKAEKRQLYLDGDQLADIADWYATERKFNDAQEVINYGLQLHPGNTGLLIEQAFLYLDTQKLSKAKEVANSITETYDSEVKMLKAELLLNEGKLEEAQQLINTIEDTDDLASIIEIVYLYMDMGYPEAAKEWIEKGQDQYGEKEDFIVLQADYLGATQHMKEAIECFDKLIDIAPYNPSYWMGLAKCYFMSEDINKTIETCDFALAADDKYGEAYAYKAHSFFYLNNPDSAIENYEKAIEYKAIPPELGYMFMGMSYATKEDWEKTEECCNQVIRIFEENGDSGSILLIDTYTNKAVAASRLGKYEEAHQLCKKAIAIQPDDPAIYLAEGKLYIQENQKKKAVKSFDKALTMEPSAEMWYMVASAYSDAEYLYQAKLCFQEAYRIDPNYADIAEKLSVLSLMHNEIDDFFKYNNESEHPISEDIILDLLSRPNQTEEGEQMLREVWERMKKEKGNN